MEKADKFDDIVFNYEYKKGIAEKSKTIFLQAKNKTDQKSVDINGLLSDSESGDFSLKKYFISYRKIKQQFSETRGPVFSGEFEDSEFIIYTNAPFVSTDSSVKEGSVDQNDFFKISDSQSKYDQLKFNSDTKERIVNLLKNSSDSRRLAKELVQSISSGKGIDMQKDIFQSYHMALKGKIIGEVKKIGDKLEGKLSDNFLNDDQDINASNENKFYNPTTQNNLKAVDFSQIDVNGTILLADVLLAKKGKRQIYTSLMDQGLSQSQMLSCTLNIRQVFEEAVKKAELKSDMSGCRLNINFVQIEKMEKEIIRKVMRGRFNEISGILKSYIEKACPGREAGDPGRLSPKKFNKFIFEFNNMSLDQSIQQILYNSNI